MKPTIFAASLLASVVTLPVVAETEMNVGVTSNYLWRGVTQSDNGASVSGGIDYAAESGFYAGTWIGSLEGGTEVDLYGGFGGEAGALSYDVGYIYYHYPNADDGDFSEVYLSGGVGGFSAGLAYTVDGEADDGNAFIEGDLYYHAGYEVELQDEYSLSFTVGHYAFDADGVGGDLDYTHYEVALSRGVKYGDLTFTLSSTDADEDTAAIASDDVNFVVSWGLSF
jgi:uncharacterized protein (TIGR02001 family)